MNRATMLLAATKELQPFALDVYPTGSSYICPESCTPESDVDVLVLGTRADAERLYVLGFTREGEGLYDLSEAGFSSWRRGSTNLIFTESREFFDKFVAATERACALRACTREARVHIFQEELYGV